MGSEKKMIDLFEKINHYTAHNYEMRTGQIYFNALYDVDSKLADSIRGTDIDPFYSNDKIKKFMKHVEQEWKKEK